MKYRNKINIEDNLRPKVTNTGLNIYALNRLIQQQPSH